MSDQQAVKAILGPERVAAIERINPHGISSGLARAKREGFEGKPGYHELAALRAVQAGQGAPTKEDEERFRAARDRTASTKVQEPSAKPENAKPAKKPVAADLSSSAE